MTAATSHAKMAEALRATRGNLMLAAKALGISRVAVWKRIHKSKDLQEIIAEERNAVIDIAEGALQRAVLNGEGWAIAFTLKTIGKSRGYVERVEQEITGRDGGPIEIKSYISPEAAESLKKLYRSGEI
jgi:hypothetical protein